MITLMVMRFTINKMVRCLVITIPSGMNHEQFYHNYHIRSRGSWSVCHMIFHSNDSLLVKLDLNWMAVTNALAYFGT